MPPPEDRTVMKQAAELLQDALREAGGSLEDVTAHPPKVESKPPAIAAHEEDEKTPARPAAIAAAAEAASAGEKPKPVEVQKAPEPVSAKRPVETPSVKPAAVRPPSVRPVPAEDAGEGEGGGAGKIVAILLAVAIAAGLIFFPTKERPQPPVPESDEVAAEPGPEPPQPEEKAAEPTPPAAAPRRR